MQAFRTLDLPCPWVPLQSTTAAASRRFRDRKELTVYLRGKATVGLESLSCASGPGTHARRRAFRAFVDERGKPQTTAKPDARGGDASDASDVGRSRGWTRCADASDVEQCRTLAEAAVQHGTRSRVTARLRASSQRASPEPGPKHGDWRFLEALKSAEASIAATKLPCWKLTAEAESAREGSIGVRDCTSARRSESTNAPSSRGMPPA
jgi:hypothetical protein